MRIVKNQVLNKADFIGYRCIYWVPFALY